MVFGKSFRELQRRLEILELKVQNLEVLPTETLIKLEKLESHHLSLRGLVNRKLNSSPENNLSEVIEEEKKKCEKFDDGLDCFRRLN